MADFRIIRYSQEYYNDWDNFVKRSKNATFLHLRAYMEYHRDRFPDHSLIIFRNKKLFALLPGTFDGDIYSSHSGLTYGGLITGNKSTTSEVLEVFFKIVNYLRDIGAQEFIYKPSPHIYHSLPAEEDLYALFRLGAKINARNIAAVIDLTNRLNFRDIRKAGIRKAVREGISIERSGDYEGFWKILQDNLMSQYGAFPVHSLTEITKLASLFPENIHLHVALKDGIILAGTVIYLDKNVAHTQYISASPTGKANGALDLLFSYLINETYAGQSYFDFGTSNEDNGYTLNESLIYQKEGFGSRGIIYDTYSLKL